MVHGRGLGFGCIEDPVTPVLTVYIRVAAVVTLHVDYVDRRTQGLHAAIALFQMIRQLIRPVP